MKSEVDQLFSQNYNKYLKLAKIASYGKGEPKDMVSDLYIYLTENQLKFSTFYQQGKADGFIFISLKKIASKSRPKFELTEINENYQPEVNHPSMCIADVEQAITEMSLEKRLGAIAALSSISGHSGSIKKIQKDTGLPLRYLTKTMIEGKKECETRLLQIKATEHYKENEETLLLWLKNKTILGKGNGLIKPLIQYYEAETKATIGDCQDCILAMIGWYKRKVNGQITSSNTDI